MHFPHDDLHFYAAAGARLRSETKSGLVFVCDQKTEVAEIVAGWSGDD
jgi:hypothetical protein